MEQCAPAVNLVPGQEPANGIAGGSETGPKQAEGQDARIWEGSRDEENTCPGIDVSVPRDILVDASWRRAPDPGTQNHQCRRSPFASRVWFIQEDILGDGGGGA